MMAAIIGGAAVALGVLAFAWWHAVQLQSALKATGAATLADEKKASRIAVLEAEVKAQTARADYQERRANALDAELDLVADSGDPDRARGRVLSRLHAAELSAAAPGSHPGAVPGGSPQPDPPVADGRGDHLLAP